MNVGWLHWMGTCMGREVSKISLLAYGLRFFLFFSFEDDREWMGLRRINSWSYFGLVLFSRTCRVLASWHKEEMFRS